MDNSNKGKICPRCRINTRDGKNNYCKPCKAEYTTEWRTKNIERVRELSRINHYHLTDEQFKTLLEAQTGQCAICRVLFTSTNVPYVDHDHSCCSTQKTCGRCIRGLLCNTCNTTLGRVERRPGWIESMNRYIDSY